MADPSPPRPAFAPGDRRDRPSAFGLEETARRIGHYRWVEMRLFEVLGGWVQDVPELAVKLRLGPHSHHHAWHAELWHERLPGLREMDPDELTVAPNDELVAFVDALGEPETPDATIERVVGAYRVLLPHKIAAYTFHRDNSSAITDAPVIRALDLALADELQDWRDGEMLIQSLLDTDDAVQRAADRQAQLEKLLLAAGGIAGPGTLGDPHAAPGPGDESDNESSA